MGPFSEVGPQVHQGLGGHGEPVTVSDEAAKQAADVARQAGAKQEDDAGYAPREASGST